MEESPKADATLLLASPWGGGGKCKKGWERGLWFSSAWVKRPAVYVEPGGQRKGVSEGRAVVRGDKIKCECSLSRGCISAASPLTLELLQEIGSLSFDKDDHLAVDFVTAASNLRSHSFGIPLLSLFEAKGIAGNIIHAIATTNAIVAGLIVLEALKVVGGQKEDCK